MRRKADRRTGQTPIPAEAALAALCQPAVLLTAQLRVRFANPAFHDFFGTTREAIDGRAIQSLAAGEWDAAGLRGAVAQAVQNDGVLEDHRLTCEVQGRGRRTLCLNARPVKGIGREAEGILMTIEDITEARQREAGLRHAAEFVQKVLDTVREPLLVLTPDLHVHSASESFYSKFKVKPDETLGRFVYDLGNGQWNIPELRRLLEDILPRERAFDDHKITHDFQHIGRRTMLLNGRRIDSIDFILLAIADVTASEEAAGRTRTVAQEVDHRANNLLTVVQAIIRLTRASTAEEYRKSVDGRIEALTRVHSLLASGRWEGADLRRVIEEELAPFGSAGGTAIRLEGPAVPIGPGAAQSLAIVLHELGTNAAKYGPFSTGGGSVDIRWSRIGEQRLKLTWSEAGGPAVSVPERRGFGSLLMERAVRNQLTGEFSFDWRADGLVFEMSVPASMLRE